MRLRSRCIGVLVAVQMAALPLPVWAGPASPPPEEKPPEGEEAPLHDPMVKARKAYERGTELYDAAKYEEALGSFLDAQRLYASPDHHFNIARCYEALERAELAIEYYRAYLRSDPADRANIENKIARLERELEAARAEADQEPDPLPTPSPVPVREEQPLGADQPPRPGRGLVITGAVLTGVGAALGLAGGIGAGVVARERSDRVDAVFQSGNPEGLQVEQTRAIDEEGRRLEAIQITTAVLGGAIAAAGVVLLVLGVRKMKRAPSATAFVGRGTAGVTVGGRF